MNGTRRTIVILFATNVNNFFSSGKGDGHRVDYSKLYYLTIDDG
jgi:hypothetical protein